LNAITLAPQVYDPRVPQFRSRQRPLQELKLDLVECWELTPLAA
jgi:hypothetical protein